MQAAPVSLAPRIAELRFEIDHLDSTTPSLRELNEGKLRELREERSELIWREANPYNTARFRVALDGAPLRFTEGGGRYCFDTRSEAEASRAENAAEFVKRGWSGEFSVQEFEPFPVEHVAPVLARAA